MGRQVHAEGLRERQRMRNNSTPTPTHDVVAVSGSGEELFVTESAFSEADAREIAEECNNPRIMERDAIPPEVDHYEVRER